MYSGPVCPPGYVKKNLTKGATISSLFHYASQANKTTLNAVQQRILGLFSAKLPLPTSSQYIFNFSQDSDRFAVINQRIIEI